MSQRDPAAEQLEEYKNSVTEQSLITTAFGTPLDSLISTLTAGPQGPVLLQDAIYIDHVSHFDRERIPERVVHAKGAGAFGYFEVTHDITKYTKMCLFANIGQRTDIAVRFSQVAGESGSADTVRDIRGFALKFYTQDGIWDLVGNNTPVFFIRDPILFPSFIHTQKRNPVTHLKDADMFWDFLSLRSESTLQVMYLFSDLGIPESYRYMDGFGVHTFKLVNADGKAFWCKFHYKTNQGIRNMSVDKAAKLSGSDPDYDIRDLYNAIKVGNWPSWTLYIQVMTLEQGKTYRYNIFDDTKVWSESDFPLIPVGKIILNRNPSNYFTDVEQIAFCPDHFIPGIEASPDKMLQGRLFSYSDTHLHRLGANNLQLLVNCPYGVRVQNYQRDGPQCIYNQNGAPNYFPNSFGGPEELPSAKIKSYAIGGSVDRFDTSDENNFEQPRLFWRNELNEDERIRLVNNIATSLKNAQEFIQERAVRNFTKVDKTFGFKVQNQLQLQKEIQGK